jgi:lipopolysaccharide transport system ATP-binding protein
MSDLVIKVEDLGKQYRLGKVGTGSFSHDLNRWWYKVRGKEDPYLKIGEVNDRTTKGESDLVWAIKDINFGVKRGEVLGIIGRNGAGKSTLLKILSRVTGPTTGVFKVKGRIASLLEVGTGFHPDLSGKENIFLNGAVLGMTRKEISSKLDEIIDFSGIERYIDTPVKRYSSGMYVRLAFAVAAHLEPEILVIDEVLAVGDLEFQKKCLGKMQDVSTKSGRTVLFVSHNLSAVRNLCTKGIVLSNGGLVFNGEADDAVNFYNSSLSFDDGAFCYERSFDENSKLPAQFMRAKLVKENESNVHHFEFTEKIGVEFNLRIREKKPDYVAGFLLQDAESNLILVSTCDEHGDVLLENKSPGDYAVRAMIPDSFLKPGKYRITISLRDKKASHHKVESCFNFEVTDSQTYRGMKNLYRKTALVAPEIEWVLC